jgi:hypothetical protein
MQMVVELDEFPGPDLQRCDDYGAHFLEEAGG